MSSAVERIPDFVMTSPLKTTTSPGLSNNAGFRRLTDSDVRAIFEALHHGKEAPSNLPFQIVRVGPNGLKLSPPSFEFEDGLYVLLRPVKSNKKKNQKQSENGEIPQPPPHLKHLLMENDLPETCPWSLSGPQFPTPTAMQQRYCYPKGRPEYSSLKGGALWTMYGVDGKEDVEYRLLHVYYSAKRAHNNGGLNDGLIGSPDRVLPALGTPSRKRAPRQQSSTPRRALPKPRTETFQIVRGVDDDYELCRSPAITTSSVTSSLCDSPFSFDDLPNISFPDDLTNGSRQSIDMTDYEGGPSSWPEQLTVSPIIDAADQRPSGRFLSEDNNRMVQARSTSSIFRSRTVPEQIATVHGNTLSLSSQLQMGDDTVVTSWDDTSLSSCDPSDLDFPLQHEIDAFWNDPLKLIGMKHSLDCGNDNNNECNHQSAPAVEVYDNTTNYTIHYTEPEQPACHSLDLFAEQLESVQEMIRELILSAPVREQPQMVHMMATWSRNLSLDPLAAVSTMNTL